MARFVVDQPITTRAPAIEVDAGLEPGVHGFSLVVVDVAGKASRADRVLVRVQRQVDPDDSPGPLRPPLRPPVGPPLRPPAGPSVRPPVRPSVRPSVRPPIDLSRPIGTPTPILPPEPPPPPLRPAQIDPQAPHRRWPQEPKP
jgi:hypothetical protein